MALGISPNKSCNGGTAWWLSCNPEPLLIDCLPVTKCTLESLEELFEGRQALIILTSREGHGRVRSIHEALGWRVLVQEQEGYLLRSISSLESFEESYVTISGVKLLWTPGPIPGSWVAYAPNPWNVLFCGRLIIPLDLERLAAVRNRGTFHWNRQTKSLARLLNWLPPEASTGLASGGNLAP